MSRWEDSVRWYVPAARDSGDFTERQLKQHLFLIIDHIDARPVDSNYHFVLRQTRTCKLVRLVEAWEQQRPLVLGIVDNVFLHRQWCHSLRHKVAATELSRYCLINKRHVNVSECNNTTAQNVYLSMDLVVCWLARHTHSLYNTYPCCSHLYASITLLSCLSLQTVYPAMTLVRTVLASPVGDMLHGSDDIRHHWFTLISAGKWEP